VKQLDNQNYNRAPCASFGSSERKLNQAQNRTKVPGPGQHNPDNGISSKYSSPPAFTVLQRREPGEAPNSKTNPGPGEYSIDASKTQTRKSAPSCRLGTAARFVMDGSKKGVNAAPGQYNVVNMSRTGHASVADSAPKWSMTGRPAFDITHCC